MAYTFHIKPLFSTARYKKQGKSKIITIGKASLYNPTQPAERHIFVIPNNPYLCWKI